MNVSVLYNLLNHSDEKWWDLYEECPNENTAKYLYDLPKSSCNPHGGNRDFFTIYTFNDKAFPETLNILSGKGYAKQGAACTRTLQCWPFTFYLFAELSDCTRRLSSWCTRSFAASSPAYRPRSCSTICLTWTGSYSCAWTSTWCGRAASWTWKRICSPNWCSCIGLRKPSSNGPGRPTKRPTKTPKTLCPNCPCKSHHIVDFVSHISYYIHFSIIYFPNS